MSALAWTFAPKREGVSAPIARLEARRLLTGFVALGGLWALTVADTVLARTRLGDADADGYAFASTVARSPFFLAQLLAHLALPAFMTEDGRTERLRQGDSFLVPPNAVHGAVALEAGVLLDVFTPMRDDFVAADA